MHEGEEAGGAEGVLEEGKGEGGGGRGRGRGMGRRGGWLVGRELHRERGAEVEGNIRRVEKKVSEH